MTSYKKMDVAARDENGAALLSGGASTGAAAALPRNDAGAAYLSYDGARDGAKDDAGGAAYAYVFSDARTAAHRRNDAAAAAYLYHPGARDATKHDAGGAVYQHHYSGAPTTEGQDEHGAAYAFSGAHTAMTFINGGSADLFPGAHAAAPAKNGAPHMFSDVHVPTAAENKEDDAACLYPSVYADAASKAFSVVRAAAVEAPAAGYYNSGVVAGEALPLASQVFSGKTTSAPAVATVGQDKLPEAFVERLRRELPVLGLSVASLAVAGLAAGEPTPAAGFGLFLMLIVGLSTVTIRALRD